jgi:SAM-dependent methyltransferase
MTSFKDHFSGHADIYREARPTYPPALFAWLSQQAPTNTLAWDCGCGNGQATSALAEHFARVIGTDPSANQIAAAEQKANIEYRVEPAEHSSLAGSSASLITVAQALHWFDHATFYSEVKRVLAPAGIFAAWAYSDCSTGDPNIDRIKDTLYNDLTGPYWPPERTHVDAGYKTLPFPFVEIAAPAFPMIARWTVEHLLAYFRSWSATQRYIKDKGADPVAIIEPQLRTAWGHASDVREVRWQFHLRCGKNS